MEKLERQYDESLNTLRAYREAVNEAAIVSITDTLGTILYVNEKFVEISQYQAGELIGQNHRIINSGYHPASFFSEMWQTIKSGNHWRGQIRNRAKDGSIYWVDTVIVPLRDKNNRVFQFLSVRNVITKQKENEDRLIRAKEQLKKREKQLVDAQHVAKTGSWHIDLPGSALDWSEETYRIFGVDPGTPVSYDIFLQLVYPDDRAMVDEAWKDALMGAPYSIEHRISTPSGIKWVKEEAAMDFDDYHRLVAATGTVQDITEKKHTEQSLQESESLYRNLFNHSPFPKGIIDSETLMFLEVNDTAVEFYRYTREEFFNMTVYDIRVPEEHSLVMQQLFDQELAWGKVMRVHHKKNGALAFVDAYISEIVFRGKPALLITIVDVTEKLQLEKKLVEAELDRQKELNRASIEATEANRAEIGRELHDNINQLLVSANIFLRSINSVTDKEAPLLNQAVGIIASVIKEVRSLSWSLVSPALRDFTLKESVENLTMIFALTNTAAFFEIDIDETRMTDNFKINLYRIIQEQFNNITKYARAARVNIQLKQDDQVLRLVITDDGQGFNASAARTGIGLANIIHRAETYNGKATITSEPGRGCKVEVVFPLEA